MSFSKEWFKNPRWSWACPSSVEPPKALCLLCNKEICVFGKNSFLNHAKTRFHKKAASELQVEVKQQPKLKEGTPTGKKGNSKKTTQEAVIPTIEILEVDEPSSQLNLNVNSVRIATESSHFGNLPKKEEEIILQKTEPDSVNCISAINRTQVSEIEECIQRLSKEIEILQHSVIEKAELCETTGNIRYVIESNTLREITEELANVKDLLRSIVTNTN